MNYYQNHSNTNEDPRDIVKMLFNRITNPYKQHAIIKFTSDIQNSTGSGKSYALLYILEQLSILMENELGGTREDYFNINNVAIITKEEIQRVVKIFKYHGLYAFDDIGVGANARSAMDIDNIHLNNIISTFRPQQNVLGMTVPKNRMIDVVQRELAHYNIIMDTPRFKEGYSYGHLLIPQETQYGNIQYVYPIWNGERIYGYYFGKPSEKLTREYDKRREEISKQLQNESMEMYGLKHAITQAKLKKQAEKLGIREHKYKYTIVDELIIDNENQ